MSLRDMFHMSENPDLWGRDTADSGWPIVCTLFTPWLGCVVGVVCLGCSRPVWAHAARRARWKTQGAEGSGEESGDPRDGDEDDDGDDDNGVCVDAGGACECSQLWDANIFNQGAYVIQSGELELHDGDQFWQTQDWCVDGDTLEIEAQTSWGVPGYRNILTLRTSLARVQ